MTAYRDLTARAGLAVRFLDVDDDGADPARLDGPAGRGVGAVFVTPAHQYPTGTTLSPPRRAALRRLGPRRRRVRGRGRLRR